MTTSSHDHDPSAGTLNPPPGCPAHVPGGMGPGGIRRIYGPEAEADMAALNEKLRAEYGPVAPVLVPGDVPAWLVLGHRENLEVMRTPSRFSRDSRRWRELREGRVAPDSPLMPLVAWQPMCSFNDGDEHERLRAAVTESMARFNRRGIRGHVTRYTNQLVNGFSADGQADLVEQFARHLPMLVMTQLLGMPEEYGPPLVQAARDMVTASETAIASNDYLVRTLRDLVARKRAEPAADFATWLVEHPARLDDDEALEHLRLVLIAAYETTTNLIANTLRMVLTDNRFRASLAGGNMTLPDAVEQSLWDEPPFTSVYGRWATGDTEIGGHHIKGGDMLILGIAAGNCDPAVRPDLSVPVHGNRSHLAFSSGPHECPGQDIARAITETGVDALLMRLPDMALAVPEEDLRWHTSLLSRPLLALPVEFTPRKPVAVTQATLTAPPRAGQRTATAAQAAQTPVSAPSPEPPAAPPVPVPVPVAHPTHRGRRPWWSSLARWMRGH